MPLQPSRRDNNGPLPTIRHHQSYLRGLDPGFLDGQWATPQLVRPGPSEIVGDDGGGEGDESALVGEDGDRLVLTHLGTQPWTLSYIPTSETLVVRWHPDSGAGVEWKRDELYTIDDDDQVITITAEVLASEKAEIGDVFSAQYLRIEGDQEAPIDSDLDSLTVRGSTLMSDDPGEIALPVGTEVGDLIVAVCATSHTIGSGPGSGFVDDPRLTQVGYGTWVGIATYLGPVNYSNPLGERMTGVVATFVPPAYYKNVSLSGTGGAGINSLAAPTVAASAAVMGFIGENPNGFGGTIDAWPAGYTKLTADSGATICKAYILVWEPDGTDSSPAGTVNYHAHSTGGAAHVDVIGLQGEET